MDITKDCADKAKETSFWGLILFGKGLPRYYEAFSEVKF